MPEATQISFSNREVLELLIKKADIHEGKWMFSALLGFTVGNFGPSPGEMSPGGVVIVQGLGLTRADPAAPPEIVVDAAVVNPKT